MKNWIILISGITFLVVVLDILVRLFYCGDISLQFNSQEFNNIASPVISFLGFVGLIITVIITLNQFKLQQSSNYFDYYRNSINKFITEKNDEKFDTIDLLNFVSYSFDKYEELKKIPEYLTDLAKFKNGENVSNTGKSYDKILGNVRYFRTKLHILLNRYELLIKEIQNHKNLSESHKDLLLKEFFENQITEYTVGLKILELELNEVKENLYIGFANYSKDQLPFFDHDFYKLKNKVESDEILKKYLEE